MTDMKRITLFFAGFLALFSASAWSAVVVPDAATMIQNLGDSIPSLIKLVTASAYVMGFYFVYKGLTELKKFGDQRTQMSGEQHMTGPILYLFVGTLLIYLPSAVSTGIATFWVGQLHPHAYDFDNADAWGNIKHAIILVVQLVGVISFIRGLVLLTHLGGSQGGQPGTMGKALAHIVAGVLCINLYGFIQVISTTLGIRGMTGT